MERTRRDNVVSIFVEIMVCGRSTFSNGGIACRDGGAVDGSLVRPIHRRDPDTGFDGRTRRGECIHGAIGLTWWCERTTGSIPVVWDLTVEGQVEKVRASRQQGRKASEKAKRRCSAEKVQNACFQKILIRRSITATGDMTSTGKRY